MNPSISGKGNSKSKIVRQGLRLEEKELQTLSQELVAYAKDENIAQRIGHEPKNSKNLSRFKADVSFWYKNVADCDRLQSHHVPSYAHEYAVNFFYRHLLASVRGYGMKAKPGMKAESSAVTDTIGMPASNQLQCRHQLERQRTRLPCMTVDDQLQLRLATHALTSMTALLGILF
jgi:hypothetical protein